jgi:hypothetical protein
MTLDEALSIMERAGLSGKVTVWEAPVGDAFKRVFAELDQARTVAADLMTQFMQFPEGYISHEFMSAQEDAIEYFETIGWLRAEPLERYWWTEQSGREETK